MAQTILVEAEEFETKGGWSIDQQFTHLMGSSYLLAHGLGRPVEDAVTSIDVAETGTYRLWVRTRNWVPGPWDPPGRFDVHIDGCPVGSEFGTREGWGWQDGGNVQLRRGKITLALHDLTGFDGRCDAILLTTDLQMTPPEDMQVLRRWRDQMRGLPETPPLAGTYDVIIVGGGISGCAAALAADQQGLAVALVHDRPILGGNASGEIRVHTEGIHGQGSDILDRIDTEHWPNGSAKALEDDRKRHQALEGAANVQLFLNWRAYDVQMNGAGAIIEAVHARHTESGDAMRLTAPVFIDATGDGWIGYWAGADYRYGRESADEFGEQWEKWGELWSPTRPDQRIMGASLLWYSREADAPVDFPEVPWATAVAKDHEATQGEWYWEYSDDRMHAIDDGEAIRDHLLRAIYGSFANAKRKAKNARRELAWVGYLCGKRESRRLIGDYIYTMRDAVSQRYFDDTVATETRAVDVHFQRILKDGQAPDFLSEAIFRPVGRYYIPFRCLYSRNIDNLMMAGRCFSCSHIGLGGPRVMNTCGQMGIATGYAAALCKAHEATPREVGQQHIEELRAIIGETGPVDRVEGKPTRTTYGKFALKDVPEKLAGLTRLTVTRGDMHAPAPPYSFTINQPAIIYLAVHDRGACDLPDSWEKTDMVIQWGSHRDHIYRRTVQAGPVDIPGHNGKSDPYYGLPHMIFIDPVADAGARLELTDLPELLAPRIHQP